MSSNGHSDPVQTIYHAAGVASGTPQQKIDALNAKKGDYTGSSRSTIDNEIIAQTNLKNTSLV